jgi:hypothetical protein
MISRYSGYKRIARLNPEIVRAFCWTHQRRDFLVLDNSYPEAKDSSDCHLPLVFAHV